MAGSSIANIAPVTPASAPAGQDAQQPQRETREAENRDRDAPETDSSDARPVSRIDPVPEISAPVMARLTMERDAESGQMIYRSINVNTGEVIKQYPDEETLKKLAAEARAEGLVVDRAV